MKKLNIAVLTVLLVFQTILSPISVYASELQGEILTSDLSNKQLTEMDKAPETAKPRNGAPTNSVAEDSADQGTEKPTDPEAEDSADQGTEEPTDPGKEDETGTG